MMARTQITLDPELWRRARKRASQLGISLAGYVRQLLAKDLHEPMHDIITSRQARERGIYDIDAILRDFEQCRRGEGDFSDRMFNTVAFELWAGMESRHLAP